MGGFAKGGGSNAPKLTDTAIRLSQVIEREAKRRSGERISRMATGISTSFKRNSRKLSSLRSSKSSAAVGPIPDNMVVPEDSSRAAATIKRKDSKVTELLRSASKVRLVPDAGTELLPVEGEDGDESRLAIMQRVWLFVDDPQSSQGAYYLSVCVFFFVTVSTFIFIAQTEKGLDPYAVELNYIETLCAAIFSLELLVRMLSCPSKVAFFKNYANWIDISSIFPFYLETMLAVENASSFGAIRIVRLTRVARVLKMSRYSSAIQVFVQAIAVSMKPLSMLIFLMSIAMIVFSSMIYFAEFTPDGCREGGWMGDCSNVDTTKIQFAVSIAGAAAARAASSTDCICVDPNPYKSIASSFWWCIVTMSTVGYGDMTPVTLVGKIVGCATVVTGMLVLALPITVIGTNFQKVMKSVMHQTMKSNVDYLKGKRMICRNEIEAILQRFHAVTEGIHLDIDDVINVYDTDNNGMLEDEELTKFRIDLEMLQNRFMLSQNQTNSASPHETVTLEQHYPGTLLSRTGSQRHSTPAVFPINLPKPRLSRHGKINRRSSAVASASTTMAAAGPGARMVPPLSRGSKSSAELILHTLQDTSFNSIAPAVTPSSDEIISIAGDACHGTPLPGVPRDSRTSSSDAPHDPRISFVHCTSFNVRTSSVHRALPDTRTSSASMEGMDSSSSSSSIHTMSEEIFWTRMLDMHRAWEERLLETEQRLETKLNNLSKTLIRMEGMMELDD